jgi:ribosomal-protein-alanine N-acetyltransferase
MTVLETERLLLRWATPDDASFVLELLNDPGWIRYIGDRGVRTIEGARKYIAEKLTPVYERHGFGLNLVIEKASGAPVGISGLIKRDALEDADVGFAFLPRWRGLGYARESAAAAIEHGRKALGLTRVVAITLPENDAAIRVLEALGLRFEQTIRWGDTGEDLSLYSMDFESGKRSGPSAPDHPAPERP